MDTVKITKRDRFESIKALCDVCDAEGFDLEGIKAFCDAEIASMAKRAAKAKERAAEKRAEDPLLDLVFDALGDELATRAEITERVDDAEATVAKVGYRLTALVKAGKAVKEEVSVVGEDGKSKKVAAYKLV